MSSSNGVVPYESRTSVRCRHCRKRRCRRIHAPVWMVETPGLDLVTLLIVDLLNWLLRR